MEISLEYFNYLSFSASLIIVTVAAFTIAFISKKGLVVVFSIFIILCGGDTFL